MDVVSSGPLPVASLVWQRNDLCALTVICKMTYELRPDESRLAAAQVDLFEEDNHWDDDTERSLYASSDIVPFKPRADVLLVGHAFAPRGAPVRSLIARLSVGALKKGVEVVCDRAWSPEGFLREGAPFARMSLRYERAAGGPGTRNPVGMRPDAPDRSGAIALPNLVRPGTSVGRRGEPLEPTGFGPIASAWPERLAKAGHRADAWSTAAFPAVIPAELDPGFFNSAPADQQIAAIRGDEPIALENLHPEHPRLVTRLAGWVPRARVERKHKAEDVELVCDTLWIDTDRGVLALTWRVHVALAHPMEEGRVTVTLDEAPRRGGSLGANQAPAEERTREIPPSKQFGGKSTATANLRSSEGGAVSVLPFHPAPPAAGPPAVGLPAVAPPAVAPSAVAVPAIVSAAAAAAVSPETSRAAPPAAPPEASPWVAAGAFRGPSSQRDPAPAPFTPPAPRLAPAAAPQSIEVVSLLWFDPQCAPRLSLRPRFLELIEKLQEQPADMDIDDQALGQQSYSVEDRRDVFEVLVRGEATDAEGMSEALAGAMREDGKFAPPVVLLGGELRAVFDAFATLRATMAAVAPFMSGDPALSAAVDSVTEVLKTPGIEESSGALEGLLSRVREAFGGGKRGASWAQVEAQVERTLLEQRRYQRRTMFGQACIRALFVPSGSKALVPTYMTEQVSGKLPLFQRMRVRLIAEVHTRQDQHEPHPEALRVLAVGHVLPPVARR